MTVTVAVLAQGEMGAAIGGALIRNGARVFTSLAGRGDSSRARSEGYGIVDLQGDDRLVAGVDFFLSILPPDQAVALAERFAGPIGRAARKPVYVDCNAVAPKTALRIGAVLESSGCRYVDAGILGGPPVPGKPGPIIHASGPDAAEFARLKEFGLDVRVMEGPIGAASALKMSFAALTKGTQALHSFVILGAKRAGMDDALLQTLTHTQPGTLPAMARFLPVMFAKAYRWEGEMTEIAAFLEEDEAARDLFQAISRLYKRLGADYAAGGEGEIAGLAEFCEEAAQALSAADKAQSGPVTG